MFLNGIETEHIEGKHHCKTGKMWKVEQRVFLDELDSKLDFGIIWLILIVEDFRFNNWIREMLDSEKKNAEQLKIQNVMNNAEWRIDGEKKLQLAK